MKLKRFRIGELPPEEHAIGIYAGLALGAFILCIGAFVLFKDLMTTFTRDGLTITLILIFRFLLMMISAYAALACIFGLFRMVNMQRMLTKKVDEGFRDFVMYARPLVEEIIRQRIISEKIADGLEKLERAKYMEGDRLRIEKEGMHPAGIPKWGEFLFFVAILANATVGLFWYLVQYPFQLVPYSLLILGIAWWVVMAKYFGLLTDVRSYYLPAAFVLVMPSLSIILRGYMLPYQAVYIVHFILFVYILVMYVHYNYMTTGRLPEIFLKISGVATEFASSIRREVDKSVPSKLREYLPHKKPEEKEGIFKKIKSRFKR